MVNYYNASIIDAKHGDVQVSKLVYGSETVWERTQPVTGNYFATVARTSGTISFSGSSATNTMSYSINGGEWSAPSQTPEVAVSAGDKVLWKGTCMPNSLNGIGQFTGGTATFDVEGNVMSLLYGDNFEGQTSLRDMYNRYQYAFSRLFSGNTNVISAKNLSLPATELSERCYGHMFQGCTSLTTAPVLPATRLQPACYLYMFSDCTSLTTATELSSTTLSSGCYYGMFKGCTGLTSAPALPAETIGIQSYAYMFQDCTSLTTDPELPATTLSNECYKYMFQGCTGLTKAPALPAETLAPWCYQGMFNGCTSLTTAPVLSATTLDTQCYKYMFSGCTSLTTAPELPATTLADSCYQSMFEGCTRLSSITCHATSFGNRSTLNWVLNVAPSGVFNYKHGTSWSQGGDGIPTGWMAIPMDDPYRNQYFTTVATSNGRIALSGRMSTFKFQYSTNSGQTWSTASQTPSVNVNAGDKVMWKANITGSTIGRFTSACTAYFNVEGNIMSLIYGDDFASQTTIPANSAFENLFSGNTRVSSAENLSLPATTLSSACYAGMFTKCASMTKAPAILPATTLSIQCYRYMFSECGLNKAPALPATTLASQCYWSMFQGSRLSTAPALPATTLADNCYNNMFNGCTNLRTAPSVLPATTLANNCYHGMFWGCSSLTTAPELPATTLADDCYSYMFVACSGLTTAPVLSATTLAQGCYDNMFNSCRSLNSITCLAHEPGTLYNSNWVNGVADTGTFTRYPAANWTRDANGIPTGWTVVDAEWPKYQAVIDGQPYSAQCNGETNITSSTTKPAGYNVSGITSAEVGACITSIGDYAFDRCENLSGVYIPYTVTSIGRQSFGYCHSLTDVRMPSGITSIGQDAFYECSSLPAVVIPDSVTTMANSTFNKCSGATSLTIGTGLTQIPQSAFRDMRALTTVTIPAGITSIGNWAFRDCTGLTKIVVNATVPPTLAAFDAFENTNNCPIIVPCDSLEAYKQAWSRYADRLDCQAEFAGKCMLLDDGGVEHTYDCGGDTVLHEDEYDELFYDYTISSVTVGSCCTEIEMGAFDRKRFTVLTIGSNVQSIGDMAFMDVDGLTEIHVLATTPPMLDGNPFMGFHGTIYVPVGTVEDYQQAWHYYAGQIVEEGSSPGA